jgi:hypothetical protein
MNRIIGASALALMFVLGWLTSSYLPGAHAQTMAGTGPQMSYSAPKDWGTCRGVSDKYLIFEDSKGTIRMAFIDSGLKHHILVQRQ